MQRFKRRGTQEWVEAFRWDGKADETVLLWANAESAGHPPRSTDFRVAVSARHPEALEVPCLNRWRLAGQQMVQTVVVRAFPGDWIVQNAQGERRVVTDPQFHADYEPETNPVLAARACEQLVRAMIAGEEPRAVSWMNLDLAYETAKQAVGRDRIRQIYAQVRPDRLEVIAADDATSDCVGPR